ncbi:nuclear transport factor 2 family protein [Pseudonocardia sp. Ae706_Ps2]|uniref:nuclear transport factor 2 family protein n=2 Tax=Pseudonocardia sp. Ae706_Ps2 TaxID=1885035 RepID=UPI000A016BF3|nr:nuclear transport factor 2 family protein [Pseudonocardia sp. Ae706_Ps2]
MALAVSAVSAVVLLAGCGDGGGGHPHPAAPPAPAPAAVPTTTPVPVDKAKLVTDFYTQAFVHRDVAGASQTYVAENYIQHNPQVPNGRAAFVDTMGPYVKDSGVTFRIGRVVAEGDIVVVHAESTEKDGKRSAIADFFRVEGGKIVEHWDVIQAIPGDTANGNPMVPGTTPSQAPGHP